MKAVNRAGCVLLGLSCQFATAATYEQIAKKQAYCQSRGESAVELYAKSEQQKSAILKIVGAEMDAGGPGLKTAIANTEMVLTVIAAKSEKDAYMAVWAKCMDSN